MLKSLWRLLSALCVGRFRRLLTMAGFTQLTAGFTVPAIGSNVTIAVADSSWMSPTQVIYIQTAGYYEVQSLPGSTSAIVKNLGTTGNAAPTTAIANGQGVSPGGVQGATGATGVGTLNSIAPTTTLGDIMADNGGGGGSASVVRVGVGTNGQALVADSAASAGVTYSTITPNSTDDNGIPRFDGTTGKPVPLQTSNLLITDTGAIQSTPSGGNARGTSAIDLQVTRAANTQVASGTNSVIVGGDNNTASGQYAAILGGSGNTCSATGSTIGAGSGNTASGQSSSVTGGTTNTASGFASVVAGGDSNTASGADAAVAGGTGNEASGDLSFIAAGEDNVASGTNAVVLGGTDNTASGVNSVTVGGSGALADKYGQISHASGFFAADGDAQTSELVFRTGTTDATPTEMFLDGTGGSQRATIATSTAWVFTGYCVVREDATGDTKAWTFSGVLKRNSTTTTALVAAVTPTQVAADGGAAAWALAVTADNTNESLKLEVTGEAVHTLRWVAWVRLVEVSN